jgi:glyoxylase-like metal-dependent hydrolase (beta-lactamase superfamily II)
MSRTLTAIAGNSQRLDGGAMFGNAPKALWTRWVQPDERNRIGLACRALLVRDTDRTVLLETGVGVSFPPRLKDRYGVVEPDHVLLSSLADVGLTHEDIDVVILSHLHFDHAGGLLSAWSEDGEPSLLFPNATFLVGERAWNRAKTPHFRDRASFLPHLNALLEASGRLVTVSESTSPVVGEGFRFHYSDGHTPGLLLTEVAMPDGPVVFAADLIPGTPWVHLPITMGYDRYPEKLIEEKQQLLGDLMERNGRLFYTHDAAVALSGIERDDRDRYRATDCLSLVQGLSA